MCNSIDDSILQTAISTWGINLQAFMAIEECGELNVALSHWLRGREIVDNEIAEEIADVAIMMRQLRLVFGPEEVDKKITEKMERLAARLSNYAEAGR